MEPENSNSPSESNSLLVHPFVADTTSRFERITAPESHLPQFSEACSMILGRISSNGSIMPDDENFEEPNNDTNNTYNQTMTMTNNDNLTLALPSDVLPYHTALEEELVFDNDDSFETSNIDFEKDESIPFRAQLEPVEEDDRSVVDAATPAAKLDREEAIAAKRRDWLAGLPEGVIPPAKPELVGFGAGVDAADSMMTSYFYGKSKIDLLNVLSFCDQLKPQLLVDILVSVSKRHPDLPIFDSPDWEDSIRAEEAAVAEAEAEAEAEAARVAAAAHARIKIHQRPRHGHTLLNPKMRKRKGVRKVVEIAAVAESEGQTVVVQEEESEVEDDVLPPMWPKAGQGLYAKLIPDDRDRSYLEDEEDGAFSHFMVDGLGNLMPLTACG